MKNPPRRPAPPPAPSSSRSRESDAPPPTQRLAVDDATFQAPASAYADEPEEETQRRQSIAPLIERTVPVLTVLTGGMQGQVLQLGGNVTQLGRHKQADIVLESIGVSRSHA